MAAAPGFGHGADGAVLRCDGPDTAVTNNAALTYLGSLIEEISEEAKYGLVAGAVAGGGLTVIANAPNSAGVALLKRGLSDESIGAAGLAAGALLPTAIAAAALMLL